MKKGLFSLVAVAVVVFALASTGVASAKSNTPLNVDVQSDYGIGGRGRMVNGAQDGILHDVMIAVFAEKLGISVEDLNARLASGETLYSIAIAQGLTVEEFQTLMTDARNQAIDQAIADGTLTQTQADWMKTRSSMMRNGTPGARGAGGARGQFGTGVCPGTPSVP